MNLLVIASWIESHGYKAAVFVGSTLGGAVTLGYIEARYLDGAAFEGGSGACITDMREAAVALGY